MNKPLTQKITSPAGEELVVCYFDIESKTAFKIPPEERDNYGVKLPDFEVTQAAFDHYQSIIRPYPEN